MQYVHVMLMVMFVTVVCTEVEVGVPLKCPQPVLLTQDLVIVCLILPQCHEKGPSEVCILPRAQTGGSADIRAITHKYKKQQIVGVVVMVGSKSTETRVVGIIADKMHPYTYFS